MLMRFRGTGRDVFDGKYTRTEQLVEVDWHVAYISVHVYHVYIYISELVSLGRQNLKGV